MDLASLMPQTIEIAKKAGEFIINESEQFDESKIEIKELNNLVSYVDKEAEKIIVAGLKEVFPEAGFITEEGSADHHDEEYKWIVDPLDGTTNFSHGLPVYSVSIGLAKGEEIVLGVVYEANRKECFHAHKGGGAFCNGNPIRVSSRHLLSTSNFIQ